MTAALEKVRSRLRGHVLVLGTEECMYPALLLAQAIEAGGSAASVAVHATTRSPIAISPDSGYPITNGYEMSSFYEKDRNTYVYNLQRYDTAIVLSDAAPESGRPPRFGVGLRALGHEAVHSVWRGACLVHTIRRT